MSKKILLTLVFLSCFTYFGGIINHNHANAQNYVNGNKPDFATMAENLLPTVVNISTVGKVKSGFRKYGHPNFQDHPMFKNLKPLEDLFKDFYGFENAPDLEDKSMVPTQKEVSSLGSGFVIDAQKGYIITNHHVISKADTITVTINNETKLEAELVGSDEKTDIAVLQVKETKELVAAKWGDSDNLRIGEWILAIGNPFGLGGTVTSGIVSARGRDIHAGPYDDFIQTDASINKGNSGGPMFNSKGEVVGVNTAIFSTMGGGSIGIGFALPANMAKTVANQLIKYGTTKRGWLGVRIQPVTDDMAESLDLEKAMGAMVTSVTADSPSSKAGLEKGDIILEFDGEKVSKMRSLPKMVAYSEIGKEVNLKVWRKGKIKSFMVKLGELEKAEKDGLLNKEDSVKSTSKRFDFPELGMNAEGLTDKLVTKYNLPDDAQGLLILKVDVNGNAADKGLRVGDLIKEANQIQINVPDELVSIIQQAKKEGKSSILLFVDRNGDERFVAVKITKDK